MLYFSNPNYNWFPYSFRVRVSAKDKCSRKLLYRSVFIAEDTLLSGVKTSLEQSSRCIQNMTRFIQFRVKKSISRYQHYRYASLKKLFALFIRNYYYYYYNTHMNRTRRPNTRAIEPLSTSCSYYFVFLDKYREYYNE